MSPIVATLLELLKYTIPALVVLVACTLIVKRFTVSELQRKQIALLREGQDVSLRLRLQAYERLVLFLERIHPRSLISRVYETGMTAKEFQAALLVTVNTEWEHNLSQQLYVSRQVWETVRTVKEQELHMVNQLAAQLKPEATAADLHRRIADAILSEPSEMPTEVALQIIHDEARKVLSLGAAG